MGSANFQTLEMLITVAGVSSCRIPEEALWAEIITSDLHFFDSCGLLLLATGPAVLSFLPASGLSEGRSAKGGVTWPRCGAALTRGLSKSLSRLAAINTAANPLQRRTL